NLAVWRLPVKRDILDINKKRTRYWAGFIVPKLTNDVNTCKSMLEMLYTHLNAKPKDIITKVEYEDLLTLAGSERNTKILKYLIYKLIGVKDAKEKFGIQERTFKNIETEVKQAFKCLSSIEVMADEIIQKKSASINPSYEKIRKY